MFCDVIIFKDVENRTSTYRQTSDWNHVNKYVCVCICMCVRPTTAEKCMLIKSISICICDRQAMIQHSSLSVAELCFIT